MDDLVQTIDAYLLIHLVRLLLAIADLFKKACELVYWNRRHPLRFKQVFELPHGHVLGASKSLFLLEHTAHLHVAADNHVLKSLAGIQGMNGVFRLLQQPVPCAGWRRWLPQHGDHEQAGPAHHQEVEYACIEAPIVQVADAISASRPGARGETMETYVKRLEDLQGIAESFGGVEKSFAVQAGREVRILVRPEEIDDLSATRLARDIVKKIEEQLTYPGQIKVTVIRETRAVEYAK